MTAFAALSLNDGVANRTFAPSSLIGNLAQWRFVTGTFDANHQASLSVSLPTGAGKVARIKGRVIVPIMDTVDASLKLGEMVCNVEYIVPKVATAAHRTVISNYVYTLQNTAAFAAAIVDLQGQY